jgi:4-diphosphocytidyl-2C-methyl-D-erythritol kinase
MVALEMDQDMNDKLDNLAEKIGDVRSAQRVSTEAFSRHEVSNQKDFQIITKELEHANEATHEMGAVAKERNAEVMAAVKDVKKDVADMGQKMVRIENLVLWVGGVGSTLFFIFNNWEKISHFLK